MNRTIFSGMTILAEDQLLQEQALIVEEDKIKAFIPKEMVSNHLPATQYIFPGDHCLVPGFIDLHVHGALGADVMDGTDEAFSTMTNALAKEGVTGFLPTTMTAPPEKIEAVLMAIQTAISSKHSAMLGVHLEGPFISRAKKGAHIKDAILLPDIDLIKRWQKKAGDVIKIVTLAPEQCDAIEFIHALSQMNVIASIGHTAATYDETMAAIAAGSTQATHLFNAMRGIHQREPGAVGALLLAEKVYAELIVDGIHLHPAIVDLAFRVKGKSKLLLVTDAMCAKCLGDGRYQLGDQTVLVAAGKATLEDGTLAGSTLTMPQAIRNMMQFSECSLIDAIYMASYNPARVLQLDSRKGSISIGKDADLVVLNDKQEVMLTMRMGTEVFAR